MFITESDMEDTIIPSGYTIGTKDYDCFNELDPGYVIGQDPLPTKE